MTVPKQAVIFCGGRGTRLGPLTDTLPKAMAPVGGRPFLEYLLDQLRRGGFSEVVLLTGYRGDQIQSHFADGRSFGLAIRYSEGPPEWETGQRLWHARQLLEPRFLLMYCDNFSPLRLGPVTRQHEASASAVTLTVVRKGRGNIRLGAGGQVALYDRERQADGLNHVEIGYMLAERDAVLEVLSEAPASYSVVLEKLTNAHRVGAYVQGDVYHSISEPARWQLAEAYLRPKNIVLLDRDGVINQRPLRGGYVRCRDEFAWIDDNIQSLHDLAQRGFSFIVVSNQAGIARGIMTRQAVDDLHRWMIEELARRGITIHEVLICPHYIHDGCACRKPLPGMFFQASRTHALRLDRTVYVGDDVRDVQAANAAGCACLFVGDAEELRTLGELDIAFARATSLAAGLPWLLDQTDYSQERR